MRTQLAITCILATAAPVHAAFRVAPPPHFNGGAFECSIVQERPRPRVPDSDPVYKINLNLTLDASGNLQSFDVVHTVRSGKTYDRSQQYSNASIWQSSNQMEWFWRGYRGSKTQMVGKLYYNSRDGWMYRETISAKGRVEYEMHADCHLTGASDSIASSDRAPPTTTATTAYDSSWHVSKSWGGEYPNGFAVIENHTVVTARATMDKKAPRTIACELPYLAVIHPWNDNRIRKNRIEFISATKTAPLIAKRDFIFSGYAGDREVKLQVKKGTTLTYLQYFGEGNFEIKLHGKKYTAGQDLFDHVDDSVMDGSAVDEWVLMTCENGVRAYIYTPDLFSRRDDGTMTHIAGISDVGPGMTDYGKARDLTPAEARKQREQ